MPNSSLTPKQQINEINRLLFLISAEASKKPIRGRDIKIMDAVKQIQTEPLFHLQKHIEQ